MFNKIKKIAVITIFFAVIAVSALLSDFEGGKVSESQNRTLASFPDMKSDEMTFESFTDEFESWSNDNIGFHDEFNRLYTKFNTVMNIPATERVHFGRDGFYFYTLNNNIQIATGEYIISDEKLSQIAENQQKISDYYKKKGKQYYVVLVPGKPSVYPEKIKGGNFNVTETTVDKIEKYLTENTDVKVINVKKTLLDSKEQGNLVFMKTDTHWTSQGSYAAYNVIMDRLISDGVISKKTEFSPDFRQTVSITGDLGNMIGTDALPPEDMNIAEWEQNFTEDTQSSEFAAVSDCLDLLSDTTDIEIHRHEQRYVNSSENVNPLTLQIYGDSLYLNVRQINQYFAESFEAVQYCRVRSVCEELDDVIDSDIVIFSTFERFSADVLANPPMLYADTSVLDNLEEISVEKADQWIANKGVYISPKGDSCTVDGSNITFDKSFEQYTFSGWAIDYNQRSDLNELFIFADDTPIRTMYGIGGKDVGEHFGYENVKNCRFKLTINRDFLIENDVKTLRFVMVSSDGIHKYEPVIYNISVE